jgi:hypothetical protein
MRLTTATAFPIVLSFSRPPFPVSLIRCCWSSCSVRGALPPTSYGCFANTKKRAPKKLCHNASKDKARTNKGWPDGAVGARIEGLAEKGSCEASKICSNCAALASPFEIASYLRFFRRSFLEDHAGEAVPGLLLFSTTVSPVIS